MKTALGLKLKLFCEAFTFFIIFRAAQKLVEKIES
jgi:hypothetical protein